MPRRKAAQESNGDIEGPSKKKLQRVENDRLLPELSQVVGEVLVCGQGDVGQLGLGDNERNFERRKPVPLPHPIEAVDVYAGGMHNLILTVHGKIYSFGCNDEGALGRNINGNESEFEPGEVILPCKALKLSAGDSHSACLLEDGRVFAWGSFRDSHGNMGLTLEGNKRFPINILPSMVFCDIASGADHLVLLTITGKVFTVGCGEQGQLGRISTRSASGESRRGKFDLLQPGQVFIKRGKPIKAVWASKYCTFLKESVTDNIYAFGLNNYNQLVKTTKDNLVSNPMQILLPNVKQIAGGQHHTLILNNDGRCYSIGRHDYGRLGLGILTESLTKIQQISKLSDQNVVSISCGETQSFAITDDGKLYSWGMGSNLQLGTGFDDDAFEPVIINEGQHMLRVSSGGQHTIFLREPKLQSDTELKKKQSAPKQTADMNSVNKSASQKIQRKKT